MRRLNARLAEVGPESRVDVVSSRSFLPSVGVFFALAAGMAVVAYLAVETTHYFTPMPQLGVPMVANVADPAPTPMANAAFVASVPTGIPVWPAVLMVGEAPMHFANMEFHESDLTR